MHAISSTRFALLLAAAFVASASHGAEVVFDDRVPGEITVIHDSGFDFGTSSNGVGFGPHEPGQTTAVGETAIFTADWQTPQAGVGNMGIVYIVDPGQTNLIRAKVEASWAMGTGHVYMTMDITSAPLGENLGLVPPEFQPYVLPLSDGLVAIDGRFYDGTTMQKTFPPIGINIYYRGDEVPECAFPARLTQAPDQSGASKSDLTVIPEQPFEQAEDITLGGDSAIYSLRWWGAYAGSSNTPQADADDFELRIYADNGGAPDAAPIHTEALTNVIRAGTGANIAGLSEFIYAANLAAPLNFAGGTTYWVAIVNNTVNDTADQWYWERSGDGNALRAERTPPGGGAWSTFASDLAIELCGVAVVFECPSDITGDDIVDGADLAALLASSGPGAGPADITNDGIVDGADLAALLAAWGSCGGLR